MEDNTNSPPKSNLLSLHPAHFHDLRKSTGLNNAIIALMGVRSVIPQQVPGFEDGLYAKVESVLEFPYPNVPGFSRYKLFPAIGEIKYYQPKDSGSHLYILPTVAEKLADTSRPLYIIEGE